MLNRRLIRIRAMQALYAFDKAKGANFLLAQDLIAEIFAPNLNSMERQDKSKLMGMQKLTQKLFSEEVNDESEVVEESIPVEIKSALIKAREFYKLKNKKDFEVARVQCLIDAEKVFDLYLYLLTFLTEIGKKDTKNATLSRNKVIVALKESKDLEHQALRRGVNWEDHGIFINRVFNEALKENPKYIAYIEKINHTAEEDTAFVKYFIKNVLLKHEVCEEFFEKMNIFWFDDKEILRTMLFHTLKDFPETQQVTIEHLDEVWEESKEFLKILFVNTVNDDKACMGYLHPILRNWDIDRIIHTDKILLKMAVTELIHFPSIPIKVTINEIIEISKNYSSMKSGQFINGVLDTLVGSLTQKQIIKKSGRGMLDNK
jgi:transcription antitermination protein NusB